MISSKKKICFLILIIFIISFLVGCSGGYVGNVTMTSPKHKLDNPLTYEDDNVKVKFKPLIEFHPAATRFRAMSVMVQNRAKGTLKIIWDESAFIDFDKTASNLLPGSVKYADIGNSIPATIIPRGAKKEIVLIPRDNVSWSDGVNIEPVFYAVGSNIEKYDGKTLSVILPFKIEEEVEEYRFDFKVDIAKKESSNLDSSY